MHWLDRQAAAGRCAPAKPTILQIEAATDLLAAYCLAGAASDDRERVEGCVAANKGYIAADKVAKPAAPAARRIELLRRAIEAAVNVLMADSKEPA